MLKKIDLGAAFLAEYGKLFRCPRCGTALHLKNHSFICHQQHQYDLSKKGTLYFLDHSIKTEYDRPMFEARGRMIRSGMYEPVLEKIRQMVKKGPILDVGCGEGSFLTEIQQQIDEIGIGFDISKEGIYLASNQPSASFWCVADLTRLPFADRSFPTILNIFSPSHYQEFDRVLTEDGLVVKVVPQENYLRELRQAFYGNEKQAYSNEQVVARFKEEMANVSQERVTYEFSVPPALRLDLLEMSPLEWSVSPEKKAALQQEPLEKITIDIELLRGNKRKR